MYVCICKAISDKQLEEANKTSKSFNDMCKNLGLGSDCGACIQDALQYLQNSPTSPHNKDNSK